MARPDFSTPEGRAAYSRELRGVGLPWRVAGLLLTACAGALMMWTDYVEAAYALFATGAAALVIAIVQRTAYHRRRVREEA